MREDADTGDIVLELRAPTICYDLSESLSTNLLYYRIQIEQKATNKALDGTSQ